MKFDLLQLFVCITNLFNSQRVVFNRDVAHAQNWKKPQEKSLEMINVSMVHNNISTKN
jgi:hypothetical protein